MNKCCNNCKHREWEVCSMFCNKTGKILTDSNYVCPKWKDERSFFDRLRNKKSESITIEEMCNSNNLFRNFNL